MKFIPEKFLHYLENYGKVICILPLHPNSNTILLALNRVGFYFTITNLVALILSFLFTAYVNSSEPLVVIKFLGLIMIYCEGASNIIIWRLKKSKFQKLLKELYIFLQCTEIKKKTIIDKCAGRYKYFYIFQVLFACLITSIRLVVSPLLQSTKLPIPVLYPFPVMPYTSMYYIVYFLQCFAFIHSISQIIFPLLVTMIFSHVLMKLEILAHDLQNVKYGSQLITCIREHQNCIGIVNNLNHVFGSIMMKTYILIGLTIILESVTFIYEVRFYGIIRAGIVVISCLLATYIYNGVADDLYMMSQSIAVTLCSLEWNDELMKMRRTLLIMICRAQKPLVISPLDGIMPALTRKMYTTFLSYLVSYIMTLRAIVSSH